MSYDIGECVICGRNIISDPGHACTPTAVARYEKRMRAVEQEPPEGRDRLTEGLEIIEKLN